MLFQPVVCTGKPCVTDIRPGPSMHVSHRFGPRGFVVPDFRSLREYQQKNTESRPYKIKWYSDRFRNINTNKFIGIDKSVAPKINKPIMTKDFRGQRMTPYLKDRANIPAYGDKALTPSNGDQSLLLVTPLGVDKIRMPIVQDRIKSPKIWIRSLAHDIKDKSKTSAVWIQIIPQNREQTMNPVVKDTTKTAISNDGSGSKNRVQKFHGQKGIVTVDAQINEDAENLHKPSQLLIQTLLNTDISPRLM